MKRLLFFAIAGFLACSINAQIGLGVKAGVNFSSMITDIEDMSSDFMTGYNVGVIANLPLKEKLSIQPGIFYSVKGTKYDNYYLGKVTNTLNYVEVPVNVVFKLGQDNLKILPFLGPYIAYGIGGTYKSEDYNEEYDIKWGSSEEDSYKPLDYGLNLGVGVQMSKLLISGQYGFGLANISDVPNYSEKLGVISISLGYMFK